MTNCKGQVLSSMNWNTIASASINFGTTLAALRRDAQEHYSTDSVDYRTYVDENKVPYFVLANTWYILLTEYADKPLPDFPTLLASRGLLPLIKEAQDVSDAIIQETQLPQSFFTMVVQYNLGYGKTVQEALQVLRYPKRFSPFHTVALEAQCYRDFLNRNNRAKMLNRREISPWLTTYLRDIISMVLKSYRISVSEEYETFASFPTGVTAEGSRTFAEKFIDMEAAQPFFFGAIGSYRTRVSSEQCRFCKAVSVPKNYKTRRIIAEEQTHRQIEMYPAFCELDRCIATSKGKYGTAGRILLHDQTRNQRMAQRGSVDGSLATIDLTAASDSVTVCLVRSLFPSDIVRQWDELRSEFVEVNGRRHLLHLYSTMGSRLTFPIETIVFWAIAVAGTETACRYNHVRFNADDISVYGDDIIVPSFAYDTVVEFLEACGFDVNQDKSYSSGLYRESCGEEYYAGYNVSSKYYPRRQVTYDGDNLDVPQTVAQLCALQHKLYFSDRCNAFLSEVVRRLYPQITYSNAGERYTDLWSAYMPKSIGCRRYGCIQTEEDNHVVTRSIKPIEAPVPKQRYYITDRSGKTTARYYSDVPVEGRSIICCDTSLINECHTTLITKYSGNSSLSRDVDRLAYIKFLKEGPEYSEPLLRFLGISDNPVREALGDRGHAKLIKLLY